MPATPRIPRSTYRLQVTPQFDLFEAAGRLAYLRDLGVDWVYLSPLLASEPGSQHGYDVVAFDRVDPERGGAEGLEALSKEAHRLGMGVLVDIVPNHVGVATPSEDAWWWDVLRLGRKSEHASAFDVDWAAGDGRIRIPVVGDDDRAEGGGPIAHLRVVDTPEGGELLYHDNSYPLAPGSWQEGDDPNEVHDRQHYELVNWHVADDGLNYRRFFAVNTLAAVRVEDPEVFAESHREIRRWFEEGLVDGLRVGHPDGLRDPKRYLDDLAALTGGAYVLVEKILEPGEELPRDWACHGTTGYDALALVDRVLVDPAGQTQLDELETRLRGAPVDWPAMVHDNKRAVADGILHSEVRRITRELRRVLAGPGCPTFDDTQDAVAELLACFPVYRSYLPDGREHLDLALAESRRRRPDLAGTFDAIEPVLADPWTQPARRFQQTSGMVMAKGVEDCSFYGWSRLTSLNEVGADPAVFAVAADEFHEAMRRRQRHWPHAMTTLSTHDTKRGEDTRARIHVLAELPELWTAGLDELLALAPLPDPGFGALLWQAVLGAWPASRERLHGYAEKAMREAGDRTTWTEPDAAYEDAVHAAVDAAFDVPAVRAVIDRLLDVVVGPGWSNSLAAKLLSITIPGVPDVYQGSELWEQSLVDPDNRRFVDFDERAALLGRLEAGAQPVLTDRPDDPGVAKLSVVHRALTLLRDRPELFTGYRGLAATGPAADHVLAFDRGGAVTVVTRLPLGLERVGGWADTTLELAPGRWREVLTDRAVTPQLADILEHLPVALLVREES
ncbi:MAG TPA: malto-oligosyltrehalose synthase [Marmoricola sp.]|nr:malto-oligosyltrehalose synthase [Marmoricola sp.]